MVILICILGLIGFLLSCFLLFVAQDLEYNYCVRIKSVFDDLDKK